MTSTDSPENPHAGQGAVLLDIGGDIGALVVTMPPDMEALEVEIRPVDDHRVGDYLGDDGPTGDHDGSHHHRHVAVVSRPVTHGRVPSLVFPDLVEGGYRLLEKGTDHVRLTVDVRGGEVTTAAWPGTR